MPVADELKPGSKPTDFNVYNETGILSIEYSLPGIERKLMHQIYEKCGYTRHQENS